MRKLNAKQKKMLKDWAIKNDKVGHILDAEDLDIYWDVYRLNEFENFNSCVENFIGELE